MLVTTPSSLCLERGVSRIWVALKNISAVACFRSFQPRSWPCALHTCFGLQLHGLNLMVILLPCTTLELPLWKTKRLTIPTASLLLTQMPRANRGEGGPGMG